MSDVPAVWSALAVLLLVSTLSLGADSALAGEHGGDGFSEKPDKADEILIMFVAATTALAGALTAVGMVFGRGVAFANRRLIGSPPDYTYDTRHFLLRFAGSLFAVWFGAVLYDGGPLLYWTTGVVAVALVGFLGFRAYQFVRALRAA